MWCTSCGWLIEHALAGLRGVASAEVLFASDLLKVRYCAAARSARAHRRARAVARLSAPRNTPAPTGPPTREQKDLLLRLGIAAFLWMNVMTLSVVIYASYFEAITASFARYLPALLMALTTPAVFYCAAPVLRLAWAGARRGAIRMESLLAIGILTAYGYSAVAAFTGGPHVYFDTACAIVTLVLAGKAIERAAKDARRRARSRCSTA